MADDITAPWAFAILLSFIVIAGLWYLGSKGGMPLSASGGARLEFFSTSTPQWYAFSGSSLTPVEGPAGFEKASVKVAEAAAAYPDGVTPVLARVPGTAGVVLGTLDQNSQFTTLLADGTEKEGLAARPDGFLIYSVVQGSARELALVDPRDKKPIPHDVGKGRAAHLAGDKSGNFIALVPEGLIAVDPYSGKRSMVVNHPHGDEAGAAISPSGSVVAFPLPFGAGGELDFFAIRLTKPAYSSYLGTLTPLPGGAAAFLDDARIAVFDSTGAALYALPTKDSRSATLIRALSVQK